MLRIEVDPITARRIVEALLICSGDIDPNAPLAAADLAKYRRRYRWIADDIGDGLDRLPRPAAEPLEAP